MRSSATALGDNDDQQTSSPSRFRRGAEIYARLNIRSAPLALVRMRLSPDNTLFTLAWRTDMVSNKIKADNREEEEASNMQKGAEARQCLDTLGNGLRSR